MKKTVHTMMMKMMMMMVMTKYTQQLVHTDLPHEKDCTYDDDEDDDDGDDKIHPAVGVHHSASQKTVL